MTIMHKASSIKSLLLLLRLTSHDVSLEKYFSLLGLNFFSSENKGLELSELLSFLPNLESHQPGNLPF